ncbi:MAG: hypothetical protein ACFCBW_08960 [Candidatus Competibacterales bacterium]
MGLLVGGCAAPLAPETVVTAEGYRRAPVLQGPPPAATAPASIAPVIAQLGLTPRVAAAVAVVDDAGLADVEVAAALDILRRLEAVLPPTAPPLTALTVRQDLAQTLAVDGPVARQLPKVQPGALLILSRWSRVDAVAQRAAQALVASHGGEVCLYWIELAEAAPAERLVGGGCGGAVTATELLLEDQLPRLARRVFYGEPADGDGDGIFDYADRCPQTPPGVRIDWDGCPWQNRRYWSGEES